MANPNPPTDSVHQGSRTENTRFSIVTITAYMMAIVGVMLIVVSGVYIYSKSNSGSDASAFTYSIPENSLDSHLGISIVRESESPTTGETPIPLEQKYPDVAQFANLYPGDLLNPKYWSEPEWAGSDPFGGQPQACREDLPGCERGRQNGCCFGSGEHVGRGFEEWFHHRESAR